MFDISKFKNADASNNRYERRLIALREKNINTDCIEKAVKESASNLVNGIKSFVVYGEPQSGKTEMMIALTAKLLDEGCKVIIVLLNDNVELLKQNLNRFRRAGLSPDPKNFSEVIDPNIQIGENEWVIFCKKNPNDLRKLIDKLTEVDQKIVLDDEADYATPNSKVNKGEKTRINSLIGDLLGQKGIYIGVTATPARLDLNNTFENANDRWVYFPPHAGYNGQPVFFPINLRDEMKYRLHLLPDSEDSPRFLQEALFSFFVTAAYLNSVVHPKEQNYSMLIHTSGRRADHTEDYRQVVLLINSLKDKNDKRFDSHVKEIWNIARQRFDEQTANRITEYICRSISRHTIVVMNSAADKKNVDYSVATIPANPFTIAIGGNIISRGVTFENLLSMFFTRDVKHKIQQDTYIQRARMFGTRNSYLGHFELSIPESLYMDWHRCFVFHGLATESIKTGNGSPVWLEDGRVSVTAGGSIDKSTVAMDSGEMSYGIFSLDKTVESIFDKAYSGEITSFTALKELHSYLGETKLPSFVIRYIENFSPNGDKSVAIHKVSSMAGFSDADQKNIQRSKGFIGKSALEESRFPNAMHHIKVFYNNENQARIFYKYVGNIKFIKNWKKYQSKNDAE